MSKHLNNNERYLKENADKYNPVPPPMVWDEIEQVLDQGNRKKRRFFILWIFGVLVIGAIMFIHLIGEEDNQSSLTKKETINSNHQKRTEENSIYIKTDKSRAIDEVTQKQDTKTSSTISADLNSREQTTVDSDKPLTFFAQQQLINSNTSTTRTSNLKANSKTVNANLQAITTSYNNQEIVVPRLSTPSTSADAYTSQVAFLKRLDWISRSFASNIPQPDPSKNLTDILTSESKSNIKGSSSWFVELGGGIGKNLSNPELINPTQGGYRLNTESNWYSWSSSIQLGHQFDNGWYTTIGFDLNQTKYKFDFWRRDISSLIITENEIAQIRNTDFFNIGEISYTFADIGLSLGRRVSLDKWCFSIEGGVIYNLQFDANGKVQVGGLEFSRLEDQEEYFNTLVGIGVRLSAMLDYPISDQLWISLGPSYHQYFKTLSSDQNPLKERNVVFQAKAKVRYYF